MDSVGDTMTERSRRVLRLAAEESHRLRHGSIQSEHVLMALAKEGDGAAALVLKKFDADLDSIRLAVSECVPVGNAEDHFKPGLSGESQELLRQAHDEVKGLNHWYVGTEHLLLAITRNADCTAYHVLTKLGVNVESLRNYILQLLANEL